MESQSMPSRFGATAVAYSPAKMLVHDEPKPVASTTALALSSVPFLSNSDCLSPTYSTTLVGAASLIFPLVEREKKLPSLELPSSLVRMPQNKEWLLRRGESAGMLRALYCNSGRYDGFAGS